MTGAIIHRGPDDEGFFTSGPVGLGFRRLSIIDLAGGHQPLCNEDKTVMVVTSASSTPLLAFIAVILGILMWPLRGKMRAIRWGLALLLIGLHLVMKAPVWFLINHIDFVSGNSGYHRALLIDMCVKHFWDWWLIGVKSTQNWGWDMWDQANQFVSEAAAGGLATLVCFVLLVSRSFGRLGSARRIIAGERNKEWLLWFLAVALFSHVISFFGISFNDQSQYAWFALLAVISAATAPILQAFPAENQQLLKVVEMKPSLDPGIRPSLLKSAYRFGQR